MTDGEECPLCSIIHGRMDAHVVYEDEDAIAFLDINPVSRGHTLVVPKEHAKQLSEVTRDRVAPLFETVQTIEAAIQEALDPDGTNIIQSNGEAAGQEIHHMHVHVVPRYASDGLSFSFDSGDLGEDEAHEILEALQGQL